MEICLQGIVLYSTITVIFIGCKESLYALFNKCVDVE